MESFERNGDSVIEHRKGEPLIEYNPEFPPEKFFGDLIAHAHNRAEGIHDGLSTCLAGGPGVMRGVAGGAQVSALYDLGFHNSFDVMSGVSTFVPALCYFSAGHPAEGVSIYYEECCGGKFLNRTNLFTNEPIADTEYLGRVFGGAEGCKGLQEDQMLKNTMYLAAVADATTGKGRLLEIGKDTSAVDAIRASIAMPLLSNGPVSIAGGLYEDGAFALPFSIEEIMRIYTSEHPSKQINRVLLLANRPYKWNHIGTRMLDYAYGRLLPSEKRHIYMKSNAEYERSLEWLKKSGIPYLIVWPFTKSSEFSAFEQRPAKVRKEAERQKEGMARLLERCVYGKQSPPRL